MDAVAEAEVRRDTAVDVEAMTVGGTCGRPGSPIR